MLIKSLVYKKDYLTTVNEKATLAEALKILEDSGFRCVPILDDTGTIFRGNIYKMHRTYGVIFPPSGKHESIGS